MGYWGDESYGGDGPMDLVSYLEEDPGAVLLSWVTGKASPPIPYGAHELLGAAMYVSMVGGTENRKGPTVTLPVEVYAHCGRVITTFLNSAEWLGNWKEPENKQAALIRELDHVLDQLEQLQPDVPRNEWKVRWRLNPDPAATQW
jgi:hypothetical protein